jgi:hypothetical protein
MQECADSVTTPMGKYYPILAGLKLDLRKDTMTCTDQTPGCSGDLCKGKVETLYLLKLILRKMVNSKFSELERTLK